MANKGGGSGMWFVQIKCQSSEISDEVLSRRRSTQFFLIELRAKCAFQITSVENEN